MSVISFFAGSETEQSIWGKAWDTILSPFQKAIGVVTTPIFNMVIILGIILVILIFIIKPKIGFKL